MLAYLLLGFAAGIRHALEADHVAAVASFATRGGSVSRQALQGAWWGVGHTLTLFCVAAACLPLGLAIPPSLQGALDGLVGAMLVALGASVLVRLRRTSVYLNHPRRAEGAVRVHAHVPVQAVLVGIVHGLAGSAALVLLVAQAARSPGTGLLYVALFGLGSILGMMGLAAAIGVPLEASARRSGRIHLVLAGGAGVSSLLIGGRLLWVLASGG